MKSLILTVLYLAKDTVHRWLTRLSSPVARVLVVFFLSLCALCFLGSYVISAKIMRDRIHEQGGDLVHLVLTSGQDGADCCLPSAQEFDSLLGADSLALRSIGYVRSEEGRGVSLYTYDFGRSAQFLPVLAPSGMPTLFVGGRSKLQPGPSSVHLGQESMDVFVRRMPEGHLLEKFGSVDNLLIVQPDSYAASLAGARGSRGTQQLILRVRDMESSEGVRRAEEYLRRYLRLEGAEGYVRSALPLLQEMDTILGNQMQCRAGFCGGIAVIVGILLTALAGMEYRQNEYIYTLMKSFGIHPILLVAAFIAENLLLVGLSFVAAVWSFMYFQKYIVAQFFKTWKYSLTLTEIMPELQLIAVSLLGCVLVSALPIIFAVNRDIGRVLK